MNLSGEDRELLEELCRQNRVSSEKVLKLLDAVREYEFKDRRTGVYDVAARNPKEQANPGRPT